MITINTLQKIRKLFDCNRQKAEEIKELIGEIAVEKVYEFEERQAIENEQELEDLPFEPPF